MKKKIKDNLYRKMGCPDLGQIIYFWKDNKKVYGKVDFVGYRKNYVELRIKPFKK